METQAYTIKYLGIPKGEKELEEIFALLCECNQDFVPPLTYRKSTSQKQFDADLSEDKPHAYFEEMRKQYFVAAYDAQDNMVAFLTFKHGYSCKELSAYPDSNYMSTACVSHAHRRQGLVSKLYTVVESYLPENMHTKYTTTRTWTTNFAQLHAFTKRGYKEVCVLENDRGEGIGTIYYARENV